MTNQIEAFARSAPVVPDGDPNRRAAVILQSLIYLELSAREIGLGDIAGQINRVGQELNRKINATWLIEPVTERLSKGA